jgi:hypothetical protein
MDDLIYTSLQNNIDSLPPADRASIQVQHRDSTSVSVEEWTTRGVSIVLQYDGGPQSHMEEYHRTIMTALFHSPTVRCVFSTKMNMALFHSYFQNDSVLLNSWSLVRFEGLMFGRSSFIGNLWIKQ